MRELRTAESRLNRVLYLLPVCCREGGATIDELAAGLGVDPSIVLEDIQEVTTRAFYHPAGSGDALQVRMDGDRVQVWTTGDFNRPTRLSPRETLALGLGLRAIAAEAPPERRVELLDLAARLEAALAAPDVIAENMRERPDMSAAIMPDLAEDVYARTMADLGEDGPDRSIAPSGPISSPRLPLATVLADDEEDILSLVLDAARERHVCRIRYLKAGAAMPEDRRIHPYQLAFSEGVWYMISFAEDRDAVRIFRVDRILEAERLEDRFEVPPDFDPRRYVAEGGRVYSAESEVEVAVRYAPEIARWIAERIPCEPAEDGSVVVRHSVADARWVVRHVLQHGAMAEVLEPVAVREMVGAVAERIAR